MIPPSIKFWDVKQTNLCKACWVILGHMHFCIHFKIFLYDGVLKVEQSFEFCRILHVIFPKGHARLDFWLSGKQFPLALETLSSASVFSLGQSSVHQMHSHYCHLCIMTTNEHLFICSLASSSVEELFFQRDNLRSSAYQGQSSCLEFRDDKGKMSSFMGHTVSCAQIITNRVLFSVGQV